MTNSAKIQELKQLIGTKITPLVDHDYVLWDLPLHKNIGDTLIFQGELDFLSELPYTCLDYSSHIFNQFPKLSPEVIILLHGGGNFGDIYPEAQAYRREVISRYPTNRIVLFPQSIHYQDERHIQADADIFNQHPDLHLFFRDEASFQLAQTHFDQCHTALLPDMAFCIRDIFQFGGAFQKGEGVLLLKRIDVEAKHYDDLESDPAIKKVSDWPTFQRERTPVFILSVLSKIMFRFRRHGLLGKVLKPIITFYYLHYMKKYLMKTGVQFLNEFVVIRTTRLHGCILAILLDKKIELLDNSYGKNEAFYQCWLKDLNSLKIYGA